MLRNSQESVESDASDASGDEEKSGTSLGAARRIVIAADGHNSISIGEENAAVIADVHDAIGEENAGADGAR